MHNFAFYLSVMGGMGAILATVQQISNRSFQRRSSVAMAFILSIVFLTLFQIFPVVYFRIMMNHINNSDAAMGLLCAFSGFIFFWLVLEKVIPEKPEIPVNKPRPGQAARAYAKAVANREY